MELRDLRYITTIAQMGTMRKAAEHLHLSQSTLSLAYRNLEAELGIPLFQRKGRRLLLTEAGNAFCQDAAMVLRDVDVLLTNMKQLSTTAEKSITVYSDADDFCDEATMLYAKAFSDAVINQVRVDMVQAKEGLLRGDADLALTLSPLDNNHFCSVRLLDEPMYAIVSKTHSLSDHLTVSLDELSVYPIITQYNGSLKELMLSFFQQAGVSPSGTIFVGDPETIVDRTLRTDGVSFIPVSVYNYHTYNYTSTMSGVVGIPINEAFCRRSVYLSYLKERRNSLFCRRYISFLELFGQMTRENQRFPNQDDLVVKGPYELAPAQECEYTHSSD